MNLWSLVSPYVQVGDKCICIYNGKEQKEQETVHHISGWGPYAAVSFGVGYIRRDQFFKKRGQWYYYYSDY
jgi:hypothetical protein